MNPDSSNKDFSPVEKEALRFLERDFNQAYQQLRHYDAQTFDLFKSAFVGYTTLIGTAVGLFQFSLKEKANLTHTILAILVIGIVYGFFALALTTRNRVYFVQVARYLNEQREIFFKIHPLGFSNRAGMYTNPKRPVFFNWRSSQSWYSYILASLNGAIFALIIHLLLVSLSVLALFFCGFGLFVAQLAIAMTYLKTREGKHGHESVFGDKESPFSVS